MVYIEIRTVEQSAFTFFFIPFFKKTEQYVYITHIALNLIHFTCTLFPYCSLITSSKIPPRKQVISKP